MVTVHFDYLSEFDRVPPELIRDGRIVYWADQLGLRVDELWPILEENHVAIDDMEEALSE